MLSFNMNIIRYNTVLLFLFFIASVSHAKSDDPIIIKVGDDAITKSELEYAYNKSHKNSDSKKQTLEQFVQSYIDLKLKIQEAKKLNLDKNPDFNSEYEAYLEELKKPYMQDTISILDYTKEIYDRLHENIEVSELFVAFPDGIILPKDTLAVYEKAKKIKKELKSNGNNFDELVRKYSNDSVTSSSSRPGYIRWMTALMTDTPIEDAIYNSPINEVSNPIRTNFGYVLAKPLARRSDQGQMKVSHIFFQYSKIDPSQQERDSIINLANNIYNRLLAGENFEELCTKYSKDKQTIDKGGVIDWFGTKNPLPLKYEAALKGIKVGEVTKPQDANYGCHIFRLDEIKEIAPFADSKKDLSEYLEKSNRVDIIRFMELNKLKKEIPFNVKKVSYHKLEELAQLYMPNDSVFNEKASVFGSDILLQIDNREYTINDFLFYLKENPYYRVRLSTDILNYAFNYFALDLVKEAKYEILLEQYPELNNLAREYYDGILLFNVTNQEIWTKAQEDNVGLKNLYNENPKKYKWNSSKYEGYLIFTKNEEIEQKAKQIIKTQKNSNNLVAILKEELNKDGQNNIVIEKGFWGKGDNDYVDSIIYNTSTNKQFIGYPEYFLEGQLIKSPRNFDDVKGQVVSEYQTILEKKWLESLYKKYKVEINKDALN